MRVLIPAAAVAMLVSAAAPVSAETKVGFRQLVTTVPVAVERGKKSEIEIRSVLTLDGAHSVFFDKPGITARFIDTTPKESPYTGRGRPGVPYRFEVDVPADQEPGVYEVRVATRTAVSSVTHLIVSEYPVVQEEKRENGASASAQPVTVPVAIAGICEQAEDVDCYRVSGTQGEELTFQIYAQRATEAVHSMQGAGNNVYLMDALLTLYGPTGQVLAQNDNFIGGDSFIHAKLPQTGDYTLEVRDARYLGDPKYVYCVEISNRPFAHATFPLSVERGKRSEVAVVGHILGETSQATLDIPADAAPGWSNVRLTTGAGETNPVGVLVSEHPQVAVGDGHGSRDAALHVALPAGVNGRFEKPDMVHYVSFDAVKDRFYLLEVISNQRGLPLDSVLEVFDAEGKKLATADDGLQTKDSILYFKAPADGKFFVSIRDMHDRGGDRFVYHLKLEPSGPDFEVHGEYYYAQLAPGVRTLWFARVNRLNGFAGPVEIHVEGLPQGVTVEPVSIPAGMTHCGLILSAADDAPVGASLVRVYGKAKLAGPDGSEREATRYGRVTCELQTQGGGQARWPIKTQLVGVVEPLDLLKVEATPAELTLKPGEKAEIKVRIERNKEYTEPVTLAMAFTYFSTNFGEQLPPGVTVGKESKLRLAGDVLEGTIVLEASEKATPVARQPVAALAGVSISFSISTNYASNPIYLTVLPAEKATAAK